MAFLRAREPRDQLVALSVVEAVEGTQRGMGGIQVKAISRLELLSFSKSVESLLERGGGNVDSGCSNSDSSWEPYTDIALRAKEGLKRGRRKWGKKRGRSRGKNSR